MTVKYHNDGEKLICVFDGRMDTVKCLEIKKELCDKISEAKGPVCFDMSNVDYIASSFLGICGTAAAATNGNSFSLCNVSPQIKRVLKIAGMAGKLKIE